jgi:hypothetical protein
MTLRHSSPQNTSIVIKNEATLCIEVRTLSRRGSAHSASPAGEIRVLFLFASRDVYRNLLRPKRYA